MKKGFVSLLMVGLLFGLQGCASQKELIGLGQSKNFTVEGKGDWKQAFRGAVVKAGGVVVENSDNRLGAEVKDHRVKVVARLVNTGVIDVTGSLVANDLRSFYSLTDEVRESAKEVASFMGDRGFVVKESK